MNASDNFVEVAEARNVVPGKMLRVYAHGSWIVVVNVAGEHFAIADTCSHESASLFKGALKDDCISCPLHGSRFNVRTGEPIEEPAEEPVDTYPVRVLNGMILLGPTSARNVHMYNR